jgi:hypothetical protein
LQIYKYGVNGSSVDFFHFARDLARWLLFRRDTWMTAYCISKTTIITLPRILLGLLETKRGTFFIVQWTSPVYNLQ